MPHEFVVNAKKEHAGNAATHVVIVVRVGGKIKFYNNDIF